MTPDHKGHVSMKGTPTWPTRDMLLVLFQQTQESKSSHSAHVCMEGSFNWAALMP